MHLFKIIGMCIVLDYTGKIEEKLLQKLGKSYKE